MDLFFGCDDVISSYASKIYEELELLVDAYGSECVAGLLPHIIKIFSVLMDKNSKIKSLESGIHGLKADNKCLLEKLNQEKDESAFILDESFEIENQIAFYQKENLTKARVEGSKMQIFACQ